jgi:hypothetical protein
VARNSLSDYFVPKLESTSPSWPLNSIRGNSVPEKGPDLATSPVLPTIGPRSHDTVERSLKFIMLHLGGYLFTKAVEIAFNFTYPG